jgi:hypothetical protein
MLNISRNLRVEAEILFNIGLKLGVTTNADRIFKGGKMNGFRRK